MSDERPARRERPKPRKISPRYLENAALHYLKRYSTSVANLRRVLLRKIDRSVKAHGGERAAYAPMVEELLAKLERNALLDDAAFARTRVASLQRRGTSRRAIRAKLQLKGVPKELLERELAQPAERDPEEAAAWALARRKRLGPFGKPELRSDRRQRDLAALVRAGFAFPLVKRVVDGEPP